VQADTPATVRVWDPFVRISHWTVVGCVLANQFFNESGAPIHRWLGYLAAALVVLRLIWGFIGTPYARFSSFFPTPSRRMPDLRRLLRRQAPRHVGHNPAGAVMMLALWLVLLALAVTGFMMGTDAFWGEEWLEEIHEALANALLVLAGLHVLAAVVESVHHREKLILSMITGRKRAAGR
jgi:cytochrome b